jgi:hypothetical protein
LIQFVKNTTFCTKLASTKKTIMKLYVFGFFIFMFLQSINAQEVKLSAISEEAKELLKSKEKGVFKFTFPNNISKVEIDQSANYYTSFFTVNFEESSHNVLITMIENNSTSRRVIMRFMAANKISNISVDGVMIPVHDFYEKYLN